MRMAETYYTSHVEVRLESMLAAMGVDGREYQCYKLLLQVIRRQPQY